MHSESIMHSDVLDIVFEKRNKLYGAYTLRKFYNNRLIKSLGVTLAAVTILSAFTLLPKKKISSISYRDVEMGSVPNPKKSDLKKEIPKSTKLNQPTQKKFPKPVIVDDKTKADTMQEIKPGDVIRSANFSGTEIPGAIGEIPAAVSTAGEAKIEVATATDVTIPVDNPEIEPSYPGGINALRKFLERNLVNPKSMDEGELVAVNVRFVVGYDGKLQQFTVVKDGGEMFNNEVIRVLKKMPQWISGKSGGQNVAVYFTIPIKFVPAD
jgi:periplasmic protein TonB